MKLPILFSFLTAIIGFIVGINVIIYFNKPIPAFVINMAIRECKLNDGLKAIQKRIIPPISYTFFCRNTARFVNVSFSSSLASADVTQKDEPEKETKLLD